MDYITKPFQAEEVLIRVKTHLEAARLTQVVLDKNRELAAMNAKLLRETSRREKAEATLETVDEQLSLVTQLEAERWGITALVVRSKKVRTILEDVRKLQPLPNTSVLITGESGTGKELIARAIHFGSPRAKGPVLPVNCSAIPSDLADALFFGCVKGLSPARPPTKAISSAPMAARCFSMKSVTCPSRSRRNCSACSKSGASCRWAAKRKNRLTSVLSRR